MSCNETVSPVQHRASGARAARPWRPAARIGLILMGLMFLLPGRAPAVTLDLPDTRLSISGYLDLGYMYMGQLPAGPAPMAVGGVSTLGQDHLNLIFRVDRDNLKANVNLAFEDNFKLDLDPMAAPPTEQTGTFEVLEAWGEWQRGDGLQVRAGRFLPPFGLYNQIRFATALYAPVVLPTLYQPPMGYSMGGGLDHLVPDEGNLMVHGSLYPGGLWVQYAAYLGAGARNPNGVDANKAKAYGAQVMAEGSGVRAGVSWYLSDEVTTGRTEHWAGSLDVTRGPLNLQGEVSMVDTTQPTAVGVPNDVLSWYARVTLQAGKAQPFIGYDYLEDDGAYVYTDGMDRWSAGVGYDVSNSMFLKAEYHYHQFDSAAAKAVDLDTAHMVRVSLITVF